MIAGKNMTVKHDTDGKITYATAEKVNFTRVQFGDKGPTINAVDAKDDKGNPVNAISVNNANISNVANGEISATSKDAVNGSQLYSLTSQHKAQMGDIHNKINRQNKELRAGIAGSNAAAGLPQVYIPGKSMIAASAGTFKGQSALAVGYSRASDNGKIILKIQGNANTRGEMGGSVGVGYQW
ncbi:YadA-like family protein [Glaesserella parasuis]|nr:YadA-like family protein [Glaesserella parasuis]